MMTRENLQEMTIKELRGIVKMRHILGCSKLNKEELIEAIYSDMILQQAAAEARETIHIIENDVDSNKENCVAVSEPVENTSEIVDENYFYSKRSATVSSSSKVWGGQERLRYTCSHCGARIGNPNDHFCYNCGYKFVEHAES